MICIINGPNLNLLGKREPEIYGHRTFSDILRELRAKFPSTEIEYFQSNCEGEIISKIHSLGYDNLECKGIIINPGAYAHYSFAIADALRSVPVEAIEVHLSNIYAREEFRSHSVTAPACKGVITGLGEDVYKLAMNYFTGK